GASSGVRRAHGASTSALAVRPARRLRSTLLERAGTLLPSMVAAAARRAAGPPILALGLSSPGSAQLAAQAVGSRQQKRRGGRARAAGETAKRGVAGQPFPS